VNRLPARRWGVDLGAVLLLLAVPIAGFWPTFGGPGYLPAAVGGALLGIGIAVAGTLRRWGMLTLAALVIAVYIVFGAALALPQTAILGVIPSLDTLRGLAVGIVTSWKELLTTVAPVAASDGFGIVPFLLSLLAGVLTASLALRARRPAWALVPAVGFLAAQIALGTSQPAAPVAQGIVFSIVAVAWLALRQAWTPTQAAVPLGDTGGRTRRPQTIRRLAAGAGIVAVAVVVGVATSGFAAPTAPRYVLRDVVIPPFDIHDYPSPLQSYRAYVRDFPDRTLFTVSGLPEGARVRLATMDAYSGTVYNVSDEGTGASSAFTPARSNMSADAEGIAATVRVEVGEMTGVWMPEVGAVREIVFDGERADDLRRTAHYNEATQTGVITSRLREGDAYQLQTAIPREQTDRALAKTRFAPVKMPKQNGVPQEFADVASKAVAEADTPIEQVRSLQTWLSENGFFSHGLEGQPRSRAGHGAERISSLLGSEQMVGDDEQYAVAMALLAGELGIPARVVMGFHPDDDAAPSPVFAATGENLHAWVEVAFDGVGWVPFDPTPPEDQVPNDQTTKPRSEPKPQVLQPPPPQQEPVDMPPTVPDDREADDDDQGDAGLLLTILAITGTTLGILALLAAPFVLIAVLKATRRRRRREAERAADRISGGWDELVDRAADYGTPVQRGSTRAEDAVVVSTAFAEPRVATLADRADAEVFGPSDPTPADVDEFWRQVDDIVGGMGADRSLWRRLRARASVRSLLAGTRFALPMRAARPPAAPAVASDDAATDSASEDPA